MNAEDRERLVRIETKLDAHLKTAEDHETRLRSVERKQWGIAGLIAFASMYFNRYGFALPTT